MTSRATTMWIIGVSAATIITIATGVTVFVCRMPVVPVVEICADIGLGIRVPDVECGRWPGYYERRYFAPEDRIPAVGQRYKGGLRNRPFKARVELAPEKGASGVAKSTTQPWGKAPTAVSPPPRVVTRGPVPVRTGSSRLGAPVAPRVRSRP